MQELTEALEACSTTGHAKEVAEDLVGAIVELYGEGLRRVVEALQRGRHAGQEIHERLVEDGVVASLLLIHDLYPIDLETRVREALATVRPYMESHGGDVELLGLDDGVARLRLVGPLRGMPGVGRDARAGHQGGARRGGPRPGRASRSRASPPRRARGIGPSPGLLQIQMPDGGAPGADAHLDGARSRRATSRPASCAR